MRGFYPAEAGIPAPAGSEALATLIVMKDAANFIRNLGTYLPGACNSTMAIAHGYSQSGAHLRVLLSSSTFGPGTFDGASSLSPPWRNIPPPGNSGATPATSGKHIGINVETDILFTGGENLRADTDNYRVYEVAGVSHVPTELAPVANSRQIPARISPVLRSMMDQLIAWVDGISIPPPSEYLDAASTNPACALVTNLDMLQLVGTPAGPDPFLDCPSLRDEDNGNVLSGGVRLPHVVTEIDGELVGAPLGNYHGVETETPFKLFGTLPNTSLAILLTGVFTRFTDQDLAERYGVEHQGEIKDVFSGFYLGRVASAAEYAESRGWISEEEKIAYIQTAQDCSAGKDMTLIAQDLLACHGL